MSETVETWKRKISKEIADCRVFRVREDLSVNSETGKEASFFVIENPDWVNIIALTKDEKIVMIQQFRHGTSEIILEIPGGMIDEDEVAETAARRELVEETGFSSGNFILLGKSNPNPAIQNNSIYHFLALDCEKNGEISFDEHESIATKFISKKEAENLIADGTIAHSLVVAAFQYFSIYNKKEE